MELREWEQLEDEGWDEDDETLYSGDAWGGTTTTGELGDLTTVDMPDQRPGMEQMATIRVQTLSQIDAMQTERNPSLSALALSGTTDLTTPLTDTPSETPTRAEGGTPTTNETADTPLAQRASARPQRTRRRLANRYRLGRKIGIGGYGAVFDAYDERLNKRVAIKVLSPALANNEEVIARFRREAIAASQIRHQSIVDVTDVGADEDGTHFIVMELLDGLDVRELLDGPLEPHRALDIAQQCASALGAAHEAGILHRDLKPANIFLVASATRPDFVKIIDFGISKITPIAGHFSDLTSASKVVGTPYYMAPEQAQGLRLDGRTDLYALGVILYEMLTGTRPFIGMSALEILGNHLIEPRVPPSAVRPPLRAITGLDELVLGAIAVEPTDRFASMAKFEEAIAACLTDLRRVNLRRRPRNAPGGFRPVGNPGQQALVSSGAIVSPIGDSLQAQTNKVLAARPETESADDDVTVFRDGPMSGRGAIQAAPETEVLGKRRRRTQLVGPGGLRSAQVRQALPMAVALVAVAMVGLSAGMWLARGKSEPPPATSQPPATSAAGSAATEPAASARVIRITSSPSGATVARPGHGQVGTTPLSFTLPPGEASAELTVSAPGHSQKRITVHDSDASIDVRLSRRR